MVVNWLKDLCIYPEAAPLFSKHCSEVNIADGLLETRVCPRHVHVDSDYPIQRNGIVRCRPQKYEKVKESEIDVLHCRASINIFGSKTPKSVKGWGKKKTTATPYLEFYFSTDTMKYEDKTFHVFLSSSTSIFAFQVSDTFQTSRCVDILDLLVRRSEKK